MAGAFDAVVVHAALIVGAVQDPGLLGRPGRPLCRRRGCLGRGRLTAALAMGQHFVVDHQFLMDGDCLLWLRAHGEGVEFLHRICR